MIYRESYRFESWNLYDKYCCRLKSFTFRVFFNYPLGAHWWLTYSCMQGLFKHVPRMSGDLSTVAPLAHLEFTQNNGHRYQYQVRWRTFFYMQVAKFIHGIKTIQICFICCLAIYAPLIMLYWNVKANGQIRWGCYFLPERNCPYEVLNWL